MSEPQTFPVTISSEAASQVAKLVTRKGDPSAFLRVGVKGGGCSGLEYVIKLDTVQRPNDLILELPDIRVVCDPKSAEFLSGATLNYTGNLIGGGFEFENPNASRSCGCGTSFTPRKK